MRILGFIAAVGAILALCGCQKTAERAPSGAAGAKGRYIGVGMYPATDLWAQLIAEAPKEPAKATLDDDEQVIVVMDGATGEMRQCGNLSGHCIGFNPWAASLPDGRGVPAALLKHAKQLAEEANAELDRQAKSVVPR